jgi:hypothetical protein
MPTIFLPEVLLFFIFSAWPLLTAQKILPNSNVYTEIRSYSWFKQKMAFMGQAGLTKMTVPMSRLTALDQKVNKAGKVAHLPCSIYRSILRYLWL